MLILRNNETYWLVSLMMISPRTILHIKLNAMWQSLDTPRYFFTLMGDPAEYWSMQIQQPASQHGEKGVDFSHTNINRPRIASKHALNAKTMLSSYSNQMSQDHEIFIWSCTWPCYCIGRVVWNINIALGSCEEPNLVFCTGETSSINFGSPKIRKWFISLVLYGFKKFYTPPQTNEWCT